MCQPRTKSYSPSEISNLQAYEIEPVLRRLNNTAPGCDNLPAWLFSKCSVEISENVAKLLNLSFTTGKLETCGGYSCTKRKCIFPAIPSDAIQDQLAFRPTGSTTCTLVHLLHHVSQMLETNNYVRCLSVDFSKAFGIVNHKLLLRKIAHVDMHDNVYNWIVSFLTDRQQRCAINGLCSSRHNTRGIVHGSGVGPIFYIIYKSDLKMMMIMMMMMMNE